MVEKKTEEQPQIQEVVINNELINYKLNSLAEMVAQLDLKVTELTKKL